MRSLFFSIMSGAALTLAACGDGGSGDSPISPADGGPTQPPPAPGPGATPGDPVGDGPLTGIDDGGQTDPGDGSLPGSGNTDPGDGSGAITPPDPSDVVGPVDGNGALLPPVFDVGSPLAGSGLTLDTFPRNLIVSGGVPKDGIPALTNPRVVAPSDVSFMQEDDLVLGVVIGGEARAYPHNIGWWHEIVNDVVGGQAICATLCPLTGTGLIFDATDTNGEQFELGVSGLLWNNNLVMYDRRDGNTLYPQIFSTGIEGSRRGETLTLLPVVETNWSTWKRLYPDTRIVADGTYNVSQYTRYPYGDYRSNNAFLIFRLTPPLERNPNFFSTSFGSKDMVLGVRMDGEAKAYPFDAMGQQAVINDEVGGVDIVVVWDRDSNIAIPFAREVDGQTLTFDIDADGAWPIGFRDRETGTLWNVRGESVEGPLSGQRLTQIPAHNSMWFAWVTFWQDTDVWPS